MVKYADWHIVNAVYLIAMNNITGPRVMREDFNGQQVEIDYA